MAGYQGFPAGDERIQQLLKYVFSVIGKGAPPPAETGPYYVPQPRRHREPPPGAMTEPLGVTTGGFGGGGGRLGGTYMGDKPVPRTRPSIMPKTSMGGTLQGPKMEPLASEVQGPQGLPMAGPGEVNDPRVRMLPGGDQKAYEAYQRATGGKLEKWGMGSGGMTGIYDPIRRTYKSEAGREEYPAGSPESERARELWEREHPSPVKTTEESVKDRAMKIKIAELMGTKPESEMKTILEGLAPGAKMEEGKYERQIIREITEAGGYEQWLKKRKKKDKERAEITVSD